MSQIDLRAFDYPLEPLLRRRRWELDALKARLGRVERDLAEATAKLEDLRARFTLQSRRAARAFAERRDPTSHPRSLRWLTDLRRQIRTAESEVATLRAERATVAALCVAQQQKVDVVERHREECVFEYARQEQARGCVEADRDWLSRGRRRVTPGGLLP